MHTSDHAEILAFIDQLSEAASDYRVDAMDALVTDDFHLKVASPDGQATTFSKTEMLARLDRRRDAGCLPLLRERRVLRIEVDGDDATAILFRRISADADPAYLVLRMMKAHGRWLAVCKTVVPWPNVPNMRDFLPAAATLAAGR